MLVLCLLAALTTAITASVDQGEIQSPNYPAAYPNNLDKTWNIEVAPGQRIQLTFESFDLEAHSDCGYDYVQISHGSFQQRYCGSSKPGPIISSGNTMTVTFHSDHSVNGNGFKATWTTWTTTNTVGVLIAGGTTGDWSSASSSAEVFNPVTGNSCPVGDLPQNRKESPMCNNMICGGLGSPDPRRSCELFDGSSSFTRLPVTLQQRRSHHLCWGLKSGEVILFGGSDDSSGNSTERVSADGSSSYEDFSLPYNTSYSCGIDLGEYFVVTGGYITQSPSLHPRSASDVLSFVTQYSEAGFYKDLAPLNQRRFNHACTKFVDESGNTALLVTGGVGGRSFLSSTEIYSQSTATWSFAASLPSARLAFSAVTLDNSVFAFGGGINIGPSSHIFSYNSTLNYWKFVGEMNETRAYHGLGLLFDVSEVCP